MQRTSGPMDSDAGTGTRSEEREAAVPDQEPMIKRTKREFTPQHVRSTHFSALLSNNLYIWGGRLELTTPTSIQHVDVFDCELFTWSKLPAKGSPPPWMLRGSSATDGRRFAYGYGGSEYIPGHHGTHNWLYQLDVETGEWIQLSGDSEGSSPDRPTLKTGEDMVYYDEGLVVFGGSTMPPETMRLSNELHVFSIKTGTWSAPVTTGTCPPPMTSFTLTKTDQQQAVLLGAKEEHSWSRDVYVLQLNSMHWTLLTFDPGLATFLHGTVCLGYGGPSPQLLVTGGQDMYASDCDIWLFDIQANTERRVILPNGHILQRTCHSADLFSSPHGGNKVVIYGGNTSEDTCATTTVLLFGVQSLQHLCKTVITDAILKRNPSLAVSNEPEELRDKLPPYVPTRIRDCVVSCVRTTLNSEICMIDLSSNT